jgi:hypothetical protein
VASSKAGESPLLGFNEPDGEKQANLTVQQALDLWPMLEKTNRRLGSPATVNPANEWMTKFMVGAKQKSCRVDFVCVHWYRGNNPDHAKLGPSALFEKDGTLTALGEFYTSFGNKAKGSPS